MVIKDGIYQQTHNVDASPIWGNRAVIFFYLMIAIEQKNPVIPLDHATILHQ